MRRFICIVAIATLQAATWGCTEKSSTAPLPVHNVTFRVHGDLPGGVRSLPNALVAVGRVEGRTDARGTVVLALPEGSTIARASSPHYYPADGQISVHAGAEYEAVLSRAAPVFLRAPVFYTGVGPRGELVEFELYNPGGVTALPTSLSGIATSSGHFRETLSSYVSVDISPTVRRYRFDAMRLLVDLTVSATNLEGFKVDFVCTTDGRGTTGSSNLSCGEVTVGGS
jgi:hypothetical protein